ncbi:MAG TPA: hypothetical protein VLZ83_13095 [Edaphocola sp.]|jgi:hypothetical protein|nr:hypothetical protein [Edaphocola sp.]
MEKRKKNLVWLILILGVLLIVYLGTGFFVIQPIRAIPEGRIIWYVRMGLNIPFVSSADGILLKNDITVSLLSRAMMISSVLDLIDDKILLKLPYSKTLYKLSTKGIEFEE